MLVYTILHNLVQKDKSLLKILSLAVGLKIFHCVNSSFLCLWRYTAQNSAKSALKITALQLADHMETMIVDLRSKYSSSLLPNVVYCRWMYALALTSPPQTMDNHSRIIHCAQHSALMLSCDYPVRQQQKEKNGGLASLHMKYLHVIFFPLIYHQSCVPVAHGYNMPLNSHYEFRYKLHHMDKQMRLLVK